MLKKDKLLYGAVLYLFIHILITPLQLKAEPPDINPWFNKLFYLKRISNHMIGAFPGKKEE